MSRKRWDDLNEILAILSMKNGGMGKSEIATIIGRSVNSLNYMVYEECPVVRKDKNGKATTDIRSINRFKDKKELYESFGETYPGDDKVFKDMETRIELWYQKRKSELSR